MKKLIIPLTAILFLGACTTHKWDAAYATKKCNEQNKGSMLGEEGIKKLCDCMGPKEAAKYATEAERDKDISGTDKILTECQLEIIKK